MHNTEYDEFAVVIKALGAVFGKEADDILIRQYWNALKDLPLGTIKRMADTRRKFNKHFPRPVELRPADEKPPLSPTDDGTFQSASALNMRNWSDERSRDPDRYELEFKIARFARIMVQHPPGSAEHESARRDDWSCREMLRKLLEHREQNKQVSRGTHGGNFPGGQGGAAS